MEFSVLYLTAFIVITFHINFHFSWNSVGPIKQCFRALFGDIRLSGEPTRRHRWQYKIALFSEATFIFKFEFTAWVVRRSTDAPFIPLQLSWQPTPFCPLRVALGVRTERRFRRITLVAFFTRYALNTCRVLQGLARRVRHHSHCKPSRTDRTEPPE